MTSPIPPTGAGAVDPAAPLPAIELPARTAHPLLAAVLIDVQQRSGGADVTVAQYEDAP